MKRISAQLVFSVLPLKEQKRSPRLLSQNVHLLMGQFFNPFLRRI